MPRGGRRVTTWTKGHGGPGRPPQTLEEKKIVTSVKISARNHTQDAIDCLVRVMNSPQTSPSVKVSAATALLDRGWGKPAQTVMGPDGEPLPGTNVAVIYSGVLAEHDKTR